MSDHWDYLTTEPNALLGWQLGAVTWADALFKTSARDLLGMYVLAYRHGVEIRRHFADEIILPDIMKWGRLTPAVWRRNPAWHPLWTVEMGRRWKDVADPRRAFQEAIDDLEGDGGRSRERELEAGIMQRMLDRQREEAVAFSAYIKDLMT